MSRRMSDSEKKILQWRWTLQRAVKNLRRHARKNYDTELDRIIEGELVWQLLCDEPDLFDVQQLVMDALEPDRIERDEAVAEIMKKIGIHD